MDKKAAKAPLKTKSGRIFNFGLILKLIKYTGLSYISLVFAMVFLCASLCVVVFNPEINSFGDACWLCFQSITTIGFGDMYTADTGTRIAIVILSLYSVFYLAIITGVVVSYVTNLVSERFEGSRIILLDKFEHLDELSKEELSELSERIKKIF